MSDRVRVQFETERAKLPTLLQLLAGEVDNIATRDMDEVLAARIARALPHAEPKRDPNRQPVPYKPEPVSAPITEGVSRMGFAAFDALLAKGVKVGDKIGYETISDMLERAGYARASRAGVITQLAEAGNLKRIGKRGDREILVISLARPA